jgi:predicted kinase
MSDTKKELILMVGLPRSGKSTYAKTTGFPIVNPDSIRLALHGERFISDAEPMVWAIAKYMVKSLFLAGHSTVILDATNTTAKRREEWVSRHWKVSIMHITTTKEVCISRAIEEGDTDIIQVIERMSENFEDPAEFGSI